ncbi:hypothetical protein B0T14DRAFT_559268 [Immersiella caudata]|uniref:Uncharacterized protein n=1 Tax=Immersiella caudata TaxID=314043 RepID=A0AA39XCL4_9PEZI|nr:hypothetical protein B0T14DRAFT_559268 [Immersiella caudata]
MDHPKASSLRGRLSRLPIMNNTSDKASKAPIEPKSRLSFLRRKPAAVTATATATAAAVPQNKMDDQKSIVKQKTRTLTLNDIATDSGPSFLDEVPESRKTQNKKDSRDTPSIVGKLKKSPTWTDSIQSHAINKMHATAPNKSGTKTVASIIRSVEEEAQCAASPFRRGRGAFYSPGSRKDESVRNRNSRRLSLLNPALPEVLDLSASRSLPTTVGPSLTHSRTISSGKPFITPATTVGSVIVECDAEDIFGNYPVCFGITSQTLKVSDIGEKRNPTPEPVNQHVQLASSPFVNTPPVPAAKGMRVVKLTPIRVPSDSTKDSDWSTTSNETVSTDSVMAPDYMTFIIPNMIVYDDGSEGSNHEEVVPQHDTQSSVMFGPVSSFMFYSDSSVNGEEGFSYIDPTLHLPKSTPVRVYSRRGTTKTPNHTTAPFTMSDHFATGSPLPLRRNAKTASLLSDPFISPLASKKSNDTKVKRRHTLTHKFLNALSLSRTQRRTTLDGIVETFGAPDGYELGMHYALGSDGLVYWEHVEAGRFAVLNDWDFAVFLSLYPGYMEVFGEVFGEVFDEEYEGEVDFQVGDDRVIPDSQESSRFEVYQD